MLAWKKRNGTTSCYVRWRKWIFDIEKKIYLLRTIVGIEGINGVREEERNGRKSRRICNSDHLHSSRRRSFERAPEKKADNKTDKGIFFFHTWPLESILESRSKRRLHIDSPRYKAIVFSSTVIQPLRVPYKKAISFLCEQKNSPLSLSQPRYPRDSYEVLFNVMCVLSVMIVAVDCRCRFCWGYWLYFLPI